MQGPRQNPQYLFDFTFKAWLTFAFNVIPLQWPGMPGLAFAWHVPDQPCFSQFHKHLTSSFFANLLLPKKLQIQT
jgi:hypothetical protein